MPVKHDTPNGVISLKSSLSLKKVSLEDMDLIKEGFKSQICSLEDSLKALKEDEVKLASAFELMKSKHKVRQELIGTDSAGNQYFVLQSDLNGFHIKANGTRNIYPGSYLKSVRDSNGRRRRGH